MTTLYAGNLPFSLRDEHLAALFSPFGPVARARVAVARETGRSSGFGFVEMEEAGAGQAVAALDGREVEGRVLRVCNARPAVVLT